ncbi:conserved hypothetical protein [Ktedonobacter racemifer DSM 44963]|uniref:ATPase AAA-type core domain-containing protein n=2 Tax=Ktedonobacter racemifer TaxID=363277 RepID=D6TX41_KTERA|nr:conserved hypothetical protein [Ktedonobacter racemifer DSM 44963]
MHLPMYKPLEDISIDFGHEPIMGRASAVHFIVGVNGSGKSRLMRALTEIFLRLASSKPLPFPVTLVYDLGADSEAELDIWLDDVANEDGTFPAYDEERAHLPKHTLFLHKPREGPTILANFSYVPPDLPEARHPWELLEEVSLEDWGRVQTLLKQGGNQLAEVIPEELAVFLKRYYIEHSPFPGEILSGISFLPDVLIAYSSGATEEWAELFAPASLNETQELLTALFSEDGKPEKYERPRHWNAFQDVELGKRLGQEPGESSPGAFEREAFEVIEPTQSTMGIFITSQALKLAVCAVTLQQSIEDLPAFQNEFERERLLRRIELLKQEGKRMDGLRGLLNEIDWLWPVTLGFKIAFYPEHYKKMQSYQLLRLYNAATTVLKEPDPSRIRHLYFDLATTQKAADGRDVSTAQALINALTVLNSQGEQANGDDQQQTAPFDSHATPLDIFRPLWNLQQAHILENVTIALRKRTVKDLILYDSLSDGEQAYLGRMALFYLLQGAQDAIILLDEPETHFNDYWKREMVDIIDNSLQNDSVEVLLSTHSSIALSDAFETEIVFLYKDPLKGQISTYQLPIKSFGASPVDIMRDVFQAPEGIGQRAAEFLDLVLMMALYPATIEAIWAADRDGTTAEELRTLPTFQELSGQLKDRITYAYAFRKDANIAETFDLMFLRAIRAVHRYTQKIRRKRSVTINDALAILESRLGPGYYQFEFRRRLRDLGRDSNAAQN